jgi:hypothetical protein
VLHCHILYQVFYHRQESFPSSIYLKSPATMVQHTDTGAAAPSQRQSCDRCHKQKLRCTRENKGNGGVCDRCLRRQAQCVYSFSLPKGRPSLYRLADESNTHNNANNTNNNNNSTTNNNSINNNNTSNKENRPVICKFVVRWTGASQR